MSPERTREVMMQYWEFHDLNKLDENAIFTVMDTGYEARGREAIGQMLHYFYHEAFEAQAELKDILIAEDQACFEAEFVGRQLSEFAGIAPTSKEIRVPFCVVYDLAHDQITRGRIYFETGALHQQSSCAHA